MSNEWYTPAKYIEAAREVMGSIDLDPASCALANQTVRAAHYYTQEDDGLSKAWYGNVWLNPPYGNVRNLPGRSGNQEGLASAFIRKLLRDFEKGNIEQAILCVTTDTDAKWFIPLWDYMICFATHKVMFHRPGMANSGQFFGTAFVYLGTNFEDFSQEFSKFGRIAKAVDVPVAKPRQLELVEVAS